MYDIIVIGAAKAFKKTLLMDAFPVNLLLLPQKWPIPSKAQKALFDELGIRIFTGLLRNTG